VTEVVFYDCTHGFQVWSQGWVVFETRDPLDMFAIARAVGRGQAVFSNPETGATVIFTGARLIPVLQAAAQMLFEQQGAMVCPTSTKED